MSGRFQFTPEEFMKLVQNTTGNNNRTVKAVKPNILKGKKNLEMLNSSSNNNNNNNNKNNNTKKAAKRAQFQKALNRQLEKEEKQKRNQTIKNLEKEANALYEKTRKHRPVLGFNPLTISKEHLAQLQKNHIQALQKYINNAKK